MAGTVMHLVVADRLIPILDIQRPALFYCGNLAPDAIMARENYVRDMKRHTHFKDGIRLHELRKPEKLEIYQKRLLDFYREYVAAASEDHELFLGYLTHMLVDELYILRFRDGFVDRLIASGKAPDDENFLRKYTRDVDLVDWELVRTHSFRYPMPDILEKERDYEIPGYITNRELLDSKAFIIKKNFVDPHEPEEPVVMTMEQNLEFIELCVVEIPRILKDRF